MRSARKTERISAHGFNPDDLATPRRPTAKPSMSSEPNRRASLVRHTSHMASSRNLFHKPAQKVSRLAALTQAFVGGFGVGGGGGGGAGGSGGGGGAKHGGGGHGSGGDEHAEELASQAIHVGGHAVRQNSFLMRQLEDERYRSDRIIGAISAALPFQSISFLRKV
jgi:hypothetical protein